MKKRIVVTGANGFIGANLCNYLFEKNYDVDCLVRNNSDISLLNVDHKLIYCDYNDDDELKKTLSQYDVVIHLAALTKGRTFDELYDANVRLTEKIVGIVSESGEKQLIFISSQAALGPSRGMVSKKENDKEAPVSWYGTTKYLAEKKVRNGIVNINDRDNKCINGHDSTTPNPSSLEGNYWVASSQAPRNDNCCPPLTPPQEGNNYHWTIIRPSSVYGEGDKDFLLFFKLVKSHLSPILGKKDKYISLIYVQDLVQIIERCLWNPKVYGKVLHATDGFVYTMEDFVTTLSTVMEKMCFTFRLPDGIIKGAAQVFDYLSSFNDKASVFNKQKALEITQESWLMDSKASMELLGLEIKPDLYGNLIQTYRWYKANGEL